MKYPIEIRVLAYVLPFILIFSLFGFPENTILFSNTILGKLFVVLIIIFYTSIHFVFGIILCILFIYYYQSKMFHRCVKIKEGFMDLEDLDDDYLGEKGSKNRQKSSKLSPSSLKNADELIISYNEDKNSKLFTDIHSNLAIETPKETETIFRQNHCVDQKLMYKNMEVSHPEMVSHIFPEIKMNNKPCNPCDPSCRFNLGLKKQEIETELKPKPTKGLEETNVYKWAESWEIKKNEPFIGVGGIYNASYV